ncbi:MFS transporter [Enterobacter hormaechei]|uniref:MFS transporter n=1 Tax=Enterobacter hormaechei TaxID=158836 RepID=UPI000BB95A3B|nr:MFS transporter [Enterobacter hormaechei]
MDSTLISARRNEETPSLNRARRAALGSFAGAVVDWYDFLLYGITAALVFNREFFPQISPAMGTLAAFATFGVGFLFRPLGGIIFGHFGDRLGRKRMLMLTVWMMGIATALIGILPSFASIGWWAPVLLVTLRAIQGFAVGGEWGGAALLSVESAPKNKKAFYSSGVQVGYGVGLLLSTGLVSLISQLTTDEQFMSWGWRIPFVFSAVLVLIGLYVRVSLHETPVFAKVAAAKKQVKVPLGTLLTKHLRVTVLGTFIMLATYTLFYIMTVYSMTYSTAAVPVGLGLPRNEVLWMLMMAVIGFGVMVPIAGLLADKFGRRSSMIVITSLIILFALFVFPPLLGSGSPALVMAYLLIGLSLMGLTFGPMGALLPELFPTEVRYTGASFSYNVSSILGASVAPYIATWLQANYGLFYVGVYLAAMAALTLIALLLTHETKHQTL